MINILMLGWELPPHITGGLGTACQGLLAGLFAARRTNVTFVLPRLLGEEDGRVARLLAAHDAAGAVAPLSASGMGAYAGTLGAEVFRFAHDAARAAAQAGPFDLIHAHDWLTVPAGVALKERSGKPLIVHVHSTEYDRSGPTPNEEILAIERLGMDSADMIVAVSEATRRQIVERFAQPAGKVRVLYNGVEPGPRYAPAAREPGARPTVCFLGRVTYQKNPHAFVRAAQRVLRQRPDVRFVLAGSGDMLASTIALAATLGIRDAFEFPGFLDKAGVRQLLAGADVYVMPSMAEPFGITALEAIAAHVPTVISKSAGVAEVVSSAHKVEPWDVDGIAAAIVALLDAPAEARQLAATALAEIAVLDWQHAAQQLNGLYLACAAGGPGEGLAAA